LKSRFYKKKTNERGNDVNVGARRRRGKLFVTEEITEEITRLTKDAERKQVVVFEER
jgi:hypothetical protein